MFIKTMKEIYFFAIIFTEPVTENLLKMNYMTLTAKINLQSHLASKFRRLTNAEFLTIN